jgi:hypothetical protein
MLALLVLFLAFADAWRLRMYNGKNYKGGQIYYKKAVGGRPCINLPRFAKNKAESIIWDMNAPCGIKFWNADGCKGNAILKSGYYTTWKKKSLGQQKNKVNSFKIQCAG